LVEEKFLSELQSQLDSIKARTKHLRPIIAEHSAQAANEAPVERSLRSVAANSSTVKESLDWNNLIKEKEKTAPPRRQKVPNPNAITMIEPKLDEKDVRYVCIFMHILYLYDFIVHFNLIIYVL
jgi:hypothetical protein